MANLTEELFLFLNENVFDEASSHYPPCHFSRDGCVPEGRGGSGWIQCVSIVIV